MADSLIKTSAKADNLITAVQTRKLLDDEIQPDSRTLVEHKVFLSTWCKKFLYTKEKEVFFLNTLKISLVPTPQEGPFQVMFCGDSTAKRASEIEYT